MFLWKPLATVGNRAGNRAYVRGNRWKPFKIEKRIETSSFYFERFPTVSTKIRTVTSTVSNGCQRFPQKHRGLSSAAAPCCRHGRHQRGQRIHPRERPPGPRKFDAAQPRSSPWLTARMLSPARGGRQTAAAAEVTTNKNRRSNASGNANNANWGTAAAPTTTRRPSSRCGIGRRTAGRVGKYHVHLKRRGDM